jgi:type I restriction enzyme M protein
VPRITKKDRPLTTKQFTEFEMCFGNDPLGRAKRKASDSKEDRWRSFVIAQVKERDYKIDGLKWLKEESLDEFDPDVEPQELAADAITELQAALEELELIVEMLEPNGSDARKPTHAKLASSNA